MDFESYKNMNLPIITDYDDKYEQFSLEELTLLCEEMNPVAWYEMASRYRLGEGVDIDVNKSMFYYKKVLECQKNTRAMYYMGILCFDELQSPDCVKYYELGSILGDADCSREIGELYRNGDYVEEDSGRALYYFRLSADQGKASSLVPIGEIYLERKDYEKAYENFTLAYQKGDTVAAYYLGRMYYYGLGVDESDEIAYPYLKMASDDDVKEANVMLGAMYGFGEGAEKDVQCAMQLLDDVIEGDMAYSYNIKGRIMLNEGNVEEGRMWLQKSAELGNKDAQKLLNAGVGKTDEEKANEGSDPYAMIRYSISLLGNKEGQKPEIHKALEVITRAKQLYPDNFDVKEQYVSTLLIHGHISRMIGAEQDAYNKLGTCIREIEYLRANDWNTERLNTLEIDSCWEYARAAFSIKDYDVALEMFNRTDSEKYPYAVVGSLLIHLDDCVGYASEIANEVRYVSQSLNSDKWGDSMELASAYAILSSIYATGIPHCVNSDVNYAYSCIQKCAELDPEMAEPELKKYSKNLFGKITYRT